MSENILVDGKPLHLLRVVDLREELKKRGIKASGTKSQLQEALISALTAQESNEATLSDSKPSAEEKSNIVEKDSTSNEENSNGSTDHSLDSEPKVASVSINEEKETIKLTIRSSPRKSEQPATRFDTSPETESESSSQSEADPNEFSKVHNELSEVKRTDGDEHEDSASPPPMNESENIVNNNEKPISESTHSNTTITADNTVESNETAASEPPPVVNHVDPAMNDDSKNKQNCDPDVGDDNAAKNVVNNDAVDTQENVEKSPAKNNNQAEPVVDTEKQLDASPPTEKVSPKKRKAIEAPAATTTTTTTTTTEQAPPPTTRRRLMSQSKSTIDESSEQESSKGKTSIRGRLLSHSKSINEENSDSSKPPVQKKRRWGSSQTGESSTVLKKGISSDELKQIINESVAESENGSTKVSKASAVDETTDSVESSANDLTNNEAETKEEKEEGESVNNKKVDANVGPNKQNIVETIAKPNTTITETTNAATSAAATTVKKNNQTEEPEKSGGDGVTQRAVSPAKNPESTVLHVTGLVRPYTLPQLKKLLSANGPIDEEKFWIDKIKSRCYVVYSTTEEAVKTREALHNLKWPQSSPKNLHVEFATLEDIDRCLHPENYEDLPPKTTLPAPAKSSHNESKANNNKKQQKDAGIDLNKGKYDIILNEPIRDKANAKNSTKDDGASSRNVREWDRNKVANQSSSRKESQEYDENNRKRARSPGGGGDQREHSHEKKEKTTRERSRTPEKSKKLDESTAAAPPLREANRKSESPAKMLEDLFRKTKATPYIYWLPLNDEQVVEKERQKEILEKERQARIAARQDSKRENNSPSPPPNRSAPAAQHQRDRPKFQDARRRSPSPSHLPSRRKRSISPSPRRFGGRYSRSRSPRRFSPRRRR